MLETLNVWVDVFGLLLAAGLVLGIVAPFFIASVLTGRIKKHFIDGYWDSLAHRMHDPSQYHYRQPISPDFPNQVRVWHWVNLVSFLILLISGMYIRYPFFEGGREVMRYAHYFFMYVITANLLFRFVWLAIAKNWRDYLVFDRADIPWAISVVKYYTFIGPPYDHFKKLNPLQRPVYPSIWVMLSLQAVTGFLIWQPSLGGPLAGLFGGPADMAAWMRLIHQINTRIMVALAVVHSFLATMEDYPVLNVFFFWKEPDLAAYDPGGHFEHSPWADHGSHDDDHGDHGDDHGDHGDHGDYDDHDGYEEDHAEGDDYVYEDETDDNYEEHDGGEEDDDR
jgi:Ni/Fe-hydrogenase 1 B-type cytochrome subunit